MYSKRPSTRGGFGRIDAHAGACAFDARHDAWDDACAFVGRPQAPADGAALVACAGPGAGRIAADHAGRRAAAAGRG